MQTAKPHYFQFHKDLDYQIFLRLDDEELANILSPVFSGLGFSALEEDEWKATSFIQGETRVLKISRAGPAVAKKIYQGAIGMAYYAPESLSSHAGHDVYRYHGVGMMVLGLNVHGHAASTWELGLVDPEKTLQQIKVILTRYLAWSLSSVGPISLWATPIEEGIVVLKPDQSAFESVFIDMKKMKLITSDGVRSLNYGMQILRLDETLKNRTRTMTPEELFSFLGANTAYLSPAGLPNAVRESLYSIVEIAVGVVYPMENFRSRQGDQLPVVDAK